MTMFTPKTYSSVEEMRTASIMDAHSEEAVCIDGNWIDIFGYVNGVPYEAVAEFDEVTNEFWITAGDAIFN